MGREPTQNRLAKLTTSAEVVANRRLLILWQLRDALISRDDPHALDLARQLTGLAAALPMEGHEK